MRNKESQMNHFLKQVEIGQVWKSGHGALVRITEIDYGIRFCIVGKVISDPRDMYRGGITKTWDNYGNYDGYYQSEADLYILLSPEDYPEVYL